MSIENSYSVILPTLNEVGHINSLIEDISNIFKKTKCSVRNNNCR